MPNGRWKDRKVRGNDVQVGDYLYHMMTYYKVAVVHYAMPEEGFVTFELTSPVEHEAPIVNRTVLADDEMIVAKRSGDAPSREWVEMPHDAIRALPVVLKQAAEVLQGRVEKHERGGGPKDRRLQHEVEQFVIFAVWAVEVAGDNDLAELIRVMRR